MFGDALNYTRIHEQFEDLRLGEGDLLNVQMKLNDSGKGLGN